MMTHHSAKRPSSAPVSCGRRWPGVRMLISNAISRRESTIQPFDDIAVDPCPASSRTPGGPQLTQRPYAPAPHARVSTLGRMDRSPSSGASAFGSGEYLQYPQAIDGSGQHESSL